MATQAAPQQADPAASASGSLVINMPEAAEFLGLAVADGQLVDLRPVQNEPISFFRVDGDLQMIFENGASVLINGFFAGKGTAPAVLVSGEGEAVLSLVQFVEIAGIAVVPEIQTAAGQPVTLDTRLDEVDGSGPSFEDPGIADLGPGLSILDLLGPSALQTEDLLPEEDLLPGLDGDGDEETGLAALNNGLEDPVNEDPDDPIDDDPIDEDPVDEEPVGDLPGSNDLLLWLDQPNHGGWVPTHYRDIIEFENLIVWINGEPVDFSLVEALSEGVNESPEADEGDYALDGPDGRQMFLNLGDLGDLPESGEIRIDFNFSNFDKRENRPDNEAGGGVENNTDEDDAEGDGGGGEGYRFGMQIGPPEDEEEAREPVVDHTDNGIAFYDEEGETPHDDDDSARTIKFDYEVTEEGEVIITNVLTIFRGGLVLDLDDNGIEMDNSVQFDMDLDGTTEEVGWMGAGDGLLVMDLNGNGIIDDASEVVGEHFQGGSNGIDDIGRYFAGAHEAMTWMDSNGDGVIDANDEAYQKLRVWVDENGDGVTDDGELKTLEDLGISSIDIDSFYEDQDSKYDGSWEDVNDNIIDREGSFTRDDGSTGSIYDTRFWESEPNLQTGTTDAADNFVLESLAGANLILDYNFEEGDRIDLGQLLDDAFGPGSNVDEYARATREADGDVLLEVDPDGAAGPEGWQAAATVEIDSQSMGDTVRLIMDTVEVDVAVNSVTV
ncbi:type I secretion C-terminal target domain-containing protein [Roseibium sp. MMSF_3544]|uniref:type I secretion C-terminal target domain-containing protein n=1 Tax=unclassified Roseibium TaxID=2629323 RepID=UPI00273DE75E|nr:type I secretion C-terminal target domain-containing protein [Roseibium sp. MMSF_3544]